MEKKKYIIVTVILCLVFIVGIDFFRKYDNHNTNTIQKQENEVVKEEIKDGKELLEKAEKIIKARGWMGAANNILGLKEGILYYYNEQTGEFRKIAIGIKDIYYKDEDSEEITVEKGKNFEEYGEKLSFLIFE